MSIPELPHRLVLVFLCGAMMVALYDASTPLVPIAKVGLYDCQVPRWESPIARLLSGIYTGVTRFWFLGSYTYTIKAQKVYTFSHRLLNSLDNMTPSAGLTGPWRTVHSWKVTQAEADWTGHEADCSGKRFGPWLSSF